MAECVVAEAFSLLHYLISTDENFWLHLCVFICSVAGYVCSFCLGGLTNTRGLEPGGSGVPARAWPRCGDGSAVWGWLRGCSDGSEPSPAAPGSGHAAEQGKDRV